MPIETIADLVGHASTAVTEEVYRHQLKPVITKGAETMNTIFNQHNQAKSAGRAAASPLKRVAPLCPKDLGRSERDSGVISVPAGPPLPGP